MSETRSKARPIPRVSGYTRPVGARGREPENQQRLMRAAVFYYFIYLVFEGALRKWFLPSFSNELFLLKDLLLGVAFVAYCSSREAVPRNRYLDPTDNLIWIIWMSLFTISLFASGISVTSLGSYRYFIAVLPIVVLLPVALRGYDELQSVARIHLFLAIGVGLLGIVQFLSPADSVINVYVRQGSSSEAPSGVATFGDMDSAEFDWS